MRSLVRSCLLTLLPLTLLVPLACAPAHQAYIEWRPGLSATDFDGTFEISLAEFGGFDDEGAAYLRLDRRRGAAKADAGQAMATLGDRFAATPAVDARGYALLRLDGEGQVVLDAGGGREHAGQVDWFALTPDGRHAAIVTGTKLSVTVGEASAGIELGALLGAGTEGYHLLMNVAEGELSVFALPELGGTVTANEPGFLVSFRYRAGGKERWDITVARVLVTM